MEGEDKNFEHILLSQYNSYLEENIKYFEKISIKKKFLASSVVGKIKLLVKLFLRIFDVYFPLELELFQRDKKIRQNLQDMSIYISLKERDKTNEKLYVDLGESCLEDGIRDGYSIDKKYEQAIRKELERKNSYLALMVESLDVGGLEEVVKLLALEYKKRNLEFKIFCTRKGGKIAEELKKEDVDVLIFERKKYIFEKYIKKNPPLMINSHFAVDFMDVIERYKIPLIETIHNMYVFLPKKRLVKEQRKSKIVSEYIAVSNAAAELFNSKVVDVECERMHIIGNTGKEFKRTMVNREKVRQAYNLPQDAFIFLVAGTIDARKNQIGTVRAWNIVTRMTNKKIALVLAGTCNMDDYEKQIRVFIKEWGLENVYILGYCDRVSDLMGASDAFVINSYYEGWSMAATEALYSGLPLIHSDCGSGIELVAGGRNGILISNPLKNIDKYIVSELDQKMRVGESENIYELVMAMLTLLQNQEEKYKKENISNFAKEKFSVDKMISDYLVVYCKACRIEKV